MIKRIKKFFKRCALREFILIKLLNSENNKVKKNNLE